MTREEAAKEIAEVLERVLVPDDQDTEGVPILKGFFVIGEFETLGEEGLWTLAGTPAGKSPSPWSVKGWLHEALDAEYFGLGR